MNNCVFVGRVTKTPQLTYTGEGTARCNFYVAVKDPQRNEPDYVPCVAWHSYAETLANVLHSGKLVSIESKFKSTNYTENGRPKVFYEFHVHHVQFLD